MQVDLAICVLIQVKENKTPKHTHTKPMLRRRPMSRLRSGVLAKYNPPISDHLGHVIVKVALVMSILRLDSSDQKEEVPCMVNNTGTKQSYVMDMIHLFT